jgi:hypothetical protein
MSKWMVVLLPLILVGCASPSDIQNMHDAEVLKYQSDLSAAQQWDTHTLGIPASGWLAIIVVACLMGFVLIILAGTWGYQWQQRRATHRMMQYKEDAAVKRAIAAKPTCGMCGYTLTPIALQDKVRDDV